MKVKQSDAPGKVRVGYLLTLRPLEQVAQIRSPASGLLCPNPSKICQKWFRSQSKIMKNPLVLAIRINFSSRILRRGDEKPPGSYFQLQRMKSKGVPGLERSPRVWGSIFFQKTDWGACQTALSATPGSVGPSVGSSH